MVVSRDMTYAAIATKAVEAEEAELRVLRAVEAWKNLGAFRRPTMTAEGSSSQLKRKMPPGPGQLQQGPPKRPNVAQARPFMQPPAPLPVCNICQKHHRGECRKLTGACFRCGQMGHQIQNCPQTTTADQRPRVPARVFAMTEEEAQVDPTVVTGMIRIQHVFAHVLIDSGASLSFASMGFAKLLGKPLEILENGYAVTMPTGEVLNSDRVIKGCEVRIKNQDFEADLVVFDLHNFDVILGMDWLTKYQATIHCGKKIVELVTPSGVSLSFKGKVRGEPTPIISAMKARKLIEKGAIGYLASICDTTKKPPLTPEEVPVVREFLELFPKDLPGLPPPREIEF